MAEKKEVRRMSDEDLAAELISAREELLDLRMQLATRQLKDVRAIPRAKHRIARAMTYQRQREMEKQSA